MKNIKKVFAMGIISLSSVSGLVLATPDTDLSIEVSDGVLSVDIVDENGEFVENPGVNMSALTFSFEDQNTSGVLGTSTEKVRLSNPTSTPEWSVSIAATNGVSAAWSDGTYSMSYNDPNGGRLTIDPSSGNVSENSISASGLPTGISLGSSATFESGVVDSVTLFSANSTASNFSFFDLTNVNVSQFVPSKQPSANYTLNLTLTAI